MYNVSKEHIDLLEKQFIAFYKSQGKAEYNIARGGGGGATWQLYDDGTIAKKMSETMKERAKDPEYIKRVSDGVSRYIANHPEYRQKMSEKLKGRAHSEEHNKKVADGLHKYYEAHEGSNKGKRFTEEHAKRISESRKGYKWFNNGVICVQAKVCPEGFVPGLTDEVKARHSRPAHNKGKVRIVDETGKAKYVNKEDIQTDDN